ncbi:PREDICTED: solute carrier family 12 member 2-like [Acropora digitifera]|uniref:solute carrier family 12 member 2-like n=1 Tax=Acropora digitifera TaxID=70779 RepID=UPI00077A9504|nr:PREDICTED: solute carrier family 12 member 2-like [Acropora digitifera]
MSDEGEKVTTTGNKETDSNRRQSGDENHSTEQTVAQKFTVKKLKFAPDSAAPPTQNSDKSAESSGPQSPQSPTSPGQFTYGYATNEAIPMTVFYRSQHSQCHSGKQRPTLQQLRKGFENDSVDLLEQGAVIVENEAEGDELEVKSRGPSKAPKFGWVRGVLFGCLLNIWGVMLYLRLSWVVGHAGIGLASVIILLSAVVTTLTTLSMSAVCTNGKIKGGGAYYLISRSLGPEFGGSIGVIFSVASAVATAMYVVGFAETVRDILRDNDSLIVDETNDIRIIGVVTIVILLGVTMVGLQWVVRAQMIFLSVLVISILNVVIGTFIGPQSEESKSNGFVGYKKDLFETNFGPGFKGETFFSVFAVFFPAATGILAGINISGDLKEVHKAVPKGTLLAILISTLVYVMLAWFVGACVEREAFGLVHNAVNVTNGSLASCMSQECQYGLLNDFQVMEAVSGWGPIVTVGIFASTLSSALASLVGAPKTFQAVCKDHLFPYIGFFGVGYGPGEEPRRGYLLAFFVAVAFVLIGDLNVIAPIISNFFLIVYALINYAVFAASLGRSPGWRPSFKYYNMWVSLLGALLCIAMMFLIEWWAALVTIVLVIVLYKYIDFTKPQVNWGSSSQAFSFVQALRYALRLEGIEDHVKNFRPHCLVLSGRPQDRPNLVYLVSHITKNVSLMVYGHVMISESFVALPSDEEDIQWMREHRIKAFRAVTAAPGLRAGVQPMMHLAGLGKMRPNTVVMGFKRNWTDLKNIHDVVDYLGVINDTFELNYGLVILRMDEKQKKEIIVHLEGDDTENSDSILNEDEYSKPKPRSSPATKSTQEERESLASPDKHSPEISEDRVETSLKEKQRGTIDVWWIYDDGGLTVLIPYLLSLHRAWKHCKLRFFSADIRSKHELSPEKLRMANLLKKFRIDASCVEQTEGISKKPSEESIAAFRRLPVGQELGDAPIEDQKVLRTIRIGELVRQNCTPDTRLVVISIPVPVTGVTTPLMYMSWLEVLSADLPPTLLVRGNQTNVLTFYS